MSEDKRIRLDSDNEERFTAMANEEEMSLPKLINMLLRNIKLVERSTKIELDQAGLKTKKKVIIAQSNWLKRY